MPAVRISINIEVDGEPIRGFPIVRRFEPSDRTGGEYTVANNVAFVAPSVLEDLAAVQALLFQPLGASMAFKLAGDGTAVTLNKGGLVLVIDSTAFSGFTLQNNSGAGAKALIVAAGS